MKKTVAYLILAVAFVSCNVPKDGEGENIPTSKLEVLTSLGDEDTTKAAAQDTTKVDAEKKKMTK